MSTERTPLETIHALREAMDQIAALKAALASKDAEIEAIRNPWISVKDRLPENRQRVIVGHSLGRWVKDDVLFVAEDQSFRLRVNAATGGDAGYKQKDTKKPNGDPAGPDDWLWGAQTFPTHWMPLPTPPKP